MPSAEWQQLQQMALQVLEWPEDLELVARLLEQNVHFQNIALDP